MRLKSASMKLMYARYLASARPGPAPASAGSRSRQTAARSRLAAGCDQELTLGGRRCRSELGHASEDEQGDAPHRRAEPPRHQRVTQLVQEHADEEHDGRHRAHQPIPPRGPALELRGVVAGGQGPRHEREDEEPRRIEPDRDARAPTEGNGAPCHAAPPDAVIAPRRCWPCPRSSLGGAVAAAALTVYGSCRQTIRAAPMTGTDRNIPATPAISPPARTPTITRMAQIARAVRASTKTRFIATRRAARS
jgi:hypothetical protein